MKTVNSSTDRHSSQTKQHTSNYRQSWVMFCFVLSRQPCNDNIHLPFENTPLTAEWWQTVCTEVLSLVGAPSLSLQRPKPSDSPMKVRQSSSTVSSSPEYMFRVETRRSGPQCHLATRYVHCTRNYYGVTYFSNIQYSIVLKCIIIMYYV